MPDPMLRVVSRLLDRQNRLEERIRVMEQSLPIPEAESLRASYVCETQIREVLKEVIDPEVGIDIVDLGLIKDIIVTGTRVEINLILTSKSCPLVDHITDQIKRKVLGVCGIQLVEVKVLDEPWNWDRYVKQRGTLKEI
jgi:serine O-acetyltransferase